MIHLTNETTILLATKPADFRKGLDGFIALCRSSLAKNPRKQGHFVFINKSKTMIRVLSYDGTGFWLMTKRLSRGTFQGWPSGDTPVNSLTAKQLSQLLKGRHISILEQKKAA